MELVALGFDNVALISHAISTIKTRDEIKLDQELFPGVRLSVPIIASPMKDVCNGFVARRIRELGGYGIIHRFCSVNTQIEMFNESGGAACAIGVNEDSDIRFESLYNAGVRNFCIDVANGASILVKDALEKYKKPDAYFIIGNFVSNTCMSFVQSLPNVSALRISVATGSACSTYEATGIYQPMLSLLESCVRAKPDYHPDWYKEIAYYTNTDNVPKLIADGGIRKPADFCKALAFGADFVILGSLIANTKESPAELLFKGSSPYKLYHGSASYENQQLYKTPKYIEGKTVLLEYREESLEQLVNRFMDGLKSSMSYFDSRTLSEYRESMDYCVIR